MGLALRPASWPAGGRVVFDTVQKVFDLTVKGLMRVSHGQDDAELCFTAHHAIVGFGGLRKRIHFDHRTDAGHFREAQSVLGVRWNPALPSLYPLLAENHRRGRHFDWVIRRSHDKQCAVRTQSANQSRHRLPARRGRQNRTRAAEFL